MTRIEICTWDYATGETDVDRAWDVTGLPYIATQAIKLAADVVAAQFAAADHATDHVVFVREV